MAKRKSNKIKTMSSEANHLHYILLFVIVFAASLLATIVAGVNNGRVGTGESEIRVVDTLDADYFDCYTPTPSFTKTFQTKKSGKAIVIFSASIGGGGTKLSLVIDGEIHSESDNIGSGIITWTFISRDLKPGTHTAEIQWSGSTCVGGSPRMAIFHG